MRAALTVSAAASIADAVGDAAKGFAGPVQVNRGASGALLQQILNGAPVDVFVPASPDEMDALEKAKRLAPKTRVAIASNRLVLIVPAGSRRRGWDDLATVGRIALSQPSAAPSGRYARETLIRRKLWTALEGKAVYGNNVRQTLAYVAGGDVDAGFVFATDARGESRVRVIAEATPGKDHPRIVYPAAALADAPTGEIARRFVAYLISRPAQATLARHGFAPPGK